MRIRCACIQATKERPIAGARDRMHQAFLKWIAYAIVETQNKVLRLRDGL